jgi:hypothetical protein
MKGIRKVNRRQLTEEEWKALLDFVIKDSKKATICGGTVSSSCLRDVLGVRQMALKVKRDAQEIMVLDLAIAAWREALRIHNFQKDKLFEYDVETGEIRK